MAVNAMKTCEYKDDARSIYKVFNRGAEEEIASTIEGKDDVHAALAGGDASQIIRLVSRMAGRCVGQELWSETLTILEIMRRLGAKIVV